MNTQEPILLATESTEFLIYVRTLQLSGLRFRGREKEESVHIPYKEIEERFFKYPRIEARIALHELVEQGELRIEEVLSAKGRKYKKYSAINSGPTDFSLLPQAEELRDELYLEMIKYLQTVSNWPGKESTDYLDCFLKNVKAHPFQFFKVDDFSGRVHTPVTNLHSHLRPNLLIDGSPTVSFDVATMQPLLLGKILQEQIGPNEFSSWINDGVDIYCKLQERAELVDRDRGKKHFFEILFSPPSNKLNKMFGATTWIKWINNYKKLVLKENPHNEEKPHSNLAWLLQKKEVEIMKKVWKKLHSFQIPFLTVHDEIIVRKQNCMRTERLFREVLSHEFSYYKLNRNK